MSVLGGVLGAAAMLAVLVLGLRATFGTGRDLQVPDPSDPTADGLLVEIARSSTEAGARALCRRLAEGGVRATTSAHTDGGYRLLVFPDDEVPAKLLLQ